MAFDVVLILNNVVALTGSAASPPPLGKSEVTIKTYNHAGEQTEILEQAFSIASRVFRKAGVVTIWLTCPLPGDPNRDATCEGTSGATVLMVKILPRSMTAAFSMPEGVFGLAALSPDAKPASSAYVFHDRVAELASAHSHRKGVVLGHVLAHEIGHLLLRSNAHSPGGIMSGDWFASNLRRAAQGQLLFTASESAHLRKEIAARLEDSRAMQTGPSLVPILLVLPVVGNAQAVNGPNGHPCQQESAGSSTTTETIVLPLEPLASRGLLLIRVTVNGRAGRLALDTGAGQTTISWQLAAISRAVFERETKAVRPQSSTHTWVTLPAKVTLGLGPLAERRVVQIADFDEVSRLAGTQIDGVLGTDVLADFAHVTIDFRARTLTLRKSVQASTAKVSEPPK
ncbi:MAG: hypothetical protein L0Z50_37225 [Verrucomicrobiales bacterium]|nr:hypothetical protein [Verrucomicrobiales bacterium]